MKKLRGVFICFFVLFSVVFPVAGTVQNLQILGTRSLSSFGSDSWSMFLHDPQHTGYSTAEAPNTNHLLWIFEPEDSFFYYSSPVVVNDSLYIGSWFTSEAPPYDDQGKVLCINASTGEPIWQEIVGGMLEGTPAVANNKVYVGTWDKKLYCLNAQNGSALWNYTTDGKIVSSPTVLDNKVYFGSYDTKVYCLDASNGSHLWNFTTDNIVMASPAVAFNRVYIASWGGTLYCLSAENGSLIWSYDMIVTVESSCAVFDNKVYVGCDDCTLYCFDALGNGDGTTTLLWAAPTYDRLYSSPAVAYGHVYIASFDGNIYCFNAENGSRIWNQSIGVYLFTSPAVADGKVYIGSSTNQRFYCFDAETGAPLWEYRTGAIYSSAAIFNNKVFVASAVPRTWVYAFQDPAELSLGDITGGFSLSTTIENIGVSDAENLEWHLFIRGGLFGFIDIHSTETIPYLKATEILPIELQQPAVGIGKVTITITATADGLTPIYKQVNGFIFGRYIFLVSGGGCP